MEKRHREEGRGKQEVARARARRRCAVPLLCLLAKCATTRQSGSSLDVVALALATITAGHSGDCSAQLLPLGGSIYHGTSPRRRGGANFFGDE
uniref:Uncharacterized protein n=1 Tax=Aegilops tauschii TaxID=37682 RepID=M8AU28_AEGTA